MTAPAPVILITGASSGFGALAARALGEAGHSVYAGIRDTGGRNAPQVETLALWASETGADVRALELDVQSDRSVTGAVETVLGERGRIDVLVHNAGHMVLGPSEAFTPAQLADQYDVNVLGAHRLNRAALPHMRARRQGLLIWVGSSSTRGGTPPWLGPYFAAKAAMDALAVCYAGELVRWGIETSILVPGAYMSGTNHFLHAGRPDDSATAKAYGEGPYAGFEDRLKAGLASLAPQDEDAGDVARAIALLVAAERGRRPFRVHVNTEPDGAHVVNAVADRVRAEFLRRAGLGDLLALPAANPNEPSS
jgi:NAD(P)-dependent dehydrogenase (short-subunit alcohol dehydrogenase family)